MSWLLQPHINPCRLEVWHFSQMEDEWMLSHEPSFHSAMTVWHRHSALRNCLLIGHCCPLSFSSRLGADMNSPPRENGFQLKSMGCTQTGEQDQMLLCTGVTQSCNYGGRTPWFLSSTICNRSTACFFKFQYSSSLFICLGVLERRSDFSVRDRPNVSGSFTKCSTFMLIFVILSLRKYSL